MHYKFAVTISIGITTATVLEIFILNVQESGNLKHRDPAKQENVV